jgi:hypothetical protein
MAAITEIVVKVSDKGQGCMVEATVTVQVTNNETCKHLVTEAELDPTLYDKVKMQKLIDDIRKAAIAHTKNVFKVVP